MKWITFCCSSLLPIVYDTKEYIIHTLINKKERPAIGRSFGFVWIPQCIIWSTIRR